MSMRPIRLASLALAVMVAPRGTAAQPLADRVAAARDEAVAFHFTSRAGVCGDGEHFIRTSPSSYHGSLDRGWEARACAPGPVQVRLTLQDGQVARVQYWVGPLRDRGARDLGAVPAAEAARYLMQIAARGEARPSAKAIFPAVLADSAVVWPGLLAIARDAETRPRSTRQEALMWLSRFAAASTTNHPNDPFVEDDDSKDEDEELKSHAVFVLSQLPRGEGVSQLLDVARTNPSAHVRGLAMFWLGQSGDPRALDFFEAVLRRR
jgi:hypothetical protein